MTPGTVEKMLRTLIRFAIIPMALFVLLQCRVSEQQDSGSVLLSLDADSSYLALGEVWVGFTDTSGKDTVVLFPRGKLDSLAQLRKLPITVPPGGGIRIVIRGYDAGTGNLVYLETRDFNVAMGILESKEIPLDLIKVQRRAASIKFSTPAMEISIRDSVRFAARVTDSDKVLSSYAWDFSGQGRFGPEFTLGKGADSVTVVHGFPDSGQYLITLQVRDASHPVALDTVRISVLNDPPTGIAGLPRSVMVGDTVRLHGVGTDRFGEVVKYEWKSSDGTYTAVAGGDTVFQAPMSAQEMTWILKVTDDDGMTDEDTVTVSVVYSPNPLLSALKLKPGSLAMPFDKNQTSYLVNVPYTQSEVSLLAVPESPTATLSYSRAVESLDSGYIKVPLQIGGNLFSVTVTAQNGKEKRQYDLIITRKKNADAALAALAVSPSALTPPFNPAIEEYDVLLENGQSSVVLTPAASDSASAKIKIGTEQAISGKPSLPIGIAIGTDMLIISVTAQDDSTVKRYTVRVSRVPSQDATLSGLELSVGTMRPPFSNKSIQYTDTLPNAVATVSIKATLSNHSSKLFLNGKEIASGAFAKPDSLKIGDNPFRLKVLAENGDSGIYSVTVRRKSANADLAALSVDQGTLRPSFSHGVTGYADTVDGAIESITINAASVDKGASSIKVKDRVFAAQTAKAELPLSIGLNEIPVIVTSEDGNTKQYTLFVYRKNGDLVLNNLEIDHGVLTPSFSSSTKEYSILLPNAFAGIAFKPTLNSALSKAFLPRAEQVTAGSFSGNLPLSVGDNLFKLTLLAESGDSAVFTIKVRRKSINTDIAQLKVSQGIVLPPLSPSVSAYFDTVAGTVSSVLVTVAAAEQLAKSVKIKDSTALSYLATRNLPLAIGNNAIPITITAEDGNSRDYILNIYRKSQDATLAALALGTGSLSPAFSPLTMTYSVSVANAVTQTTFKPSVSVPLSKAYLKNKLIPAGAFSDPYALDVGDNAVKIKVQAESGDTAIYTINVRRKSASANLTGLRVNAGTLKPAFNPATLAYADTVPVGTKSVILTGLAYGQRVQSITIGGNAFASDSASMEFPVNASISPLRIPIEVKAEDGNVFAYTVRIACHGFIRTVGTAVDERGYSVVETSDGGYLTMGWGGNIPGNQEDVFQVKFNGDGDTLWTKSVGTNGYEVPIDIAQTSDNGYIVAGLAEDDGGQYIGAMLMKLNASGAMEWREVVGKVPEQSMVQSVIQAKDGGYAACGYVSDETGAVVKPFMMRINGAGDTLWTRTLNIATYGIISNVKQAADGGFIATGFTMGVGGKDYDIFVVKFDANGGITWSKTYGGSASDNGAAVLEVGDGFLVFCSTQAGSASAGDIQIMKINPAGDSLWAKAYETAPKELVHNVFVTRDGGYAIVGNISTATPSKYDLYMLRLDVAFNKLWGRSYGTAANDEGSAIRQTKDGGFIAVGYNDPGPNGKGDLYLIKTDSDGFAE